MTKRIISFALCLLMLAALVPFSAVSAETAPETASGAYQLEANTPLMNSQATGITNNAVYKIRGYNSNYYITLRNYNIASPSNTRSYDTNLNNVEVDTNTSLSDQEFRVVYNSSSDTYYIKAIKSADGTNRHLDVLSANASQIVDGKNIHIYAPGDENSSQWLIVSLGSGVYKIVLNYNQNLAITRTSGNNVQVNTYTGSSSQKWTFEEVTYTPVPITTNSIFRIKDLNSGLYVSVPGNDANLSNVALAVGDSSSAKQKFKFVYDTTNDVYYIKAMMSSNGNNRLLDVNSTASQPPVNGRNVHIYTAGDFTSSAWLVDDINGSGLAKIYMNYNNHLVLTAADGGTTAGTNIQVNNYTGEAYQKWILEPVDVPVTGIQLNETNIEVEKGQTFQLTASFSEYGAPTNFTWSVISGSGVTVSSNGLVSANDYGSAVVRASITYNGVWYYATCYVKVHKRAIIIIPGIMGSNLYANENIVIMTADHPEVLLENTKLWDPPMDLTAKEKINALKCNTDGTSINYIRRFISDYDLAEYKDINQPEDNGYYGTSRTYETIYEYLDSNFGRNSNSNKKYDIIFFDYDWRLSNTINADRLDIYINTLQYTKVILVGHSMGGIVASHYVNKGSAQRAKVEKLITLGTPFFGSVNMTSIYLNNELPIGDQQYASYIMPEEKLCNMASVYQLFPSQRYFSIAGKNYLTKNSICTTYAATRTVLETDLFSCNEGLFDLAEDVDSALFNNGDHITNMVDSYYFCGYNKSTIKHLTFIENDNYSKTYTSKGDGTVPIWSANLDGMYPYKTFYAENVEHTDLANNSSILLKIKHIINDAAGTTVLGITQTQPDY